jgi:ribosome-associated protein
MLTINDEISIRISEFRFSYTRSPGPGGQHVNKVNSKAIMKWSVDKSNALPDAMKQRFMKKFARRITKDGELVIQSHRYREQGRNVADCLHKLREMILEVAVEPKKRKPAKVSKSAKRRRVEAKRRKSAKKQARRGPKMDD